MRYYHVTIGVTKNADLTDETISSLHEMQLWFTVPDRHPLEAGQIIAGMLSDLHVTRYMKVYEIGEITKEEFYSE